MYRREVGVHLSSISSLFVPYITIMMLLGSHQPIVFQYQYMMKKGKKNMSKKDSCLKGYPSTLAKYYNAINYDMRCDYTYDMGTPIDLYPPADNVVITLDRASIALKSRITVLSAIYYIKARKQENAIQPHLKAIQEYVKNHYSVYSKNAYKLVPFDETLVCIKVGKEQTPIWDVVITKKNTNLLSRLMAVVSNYLFSFFGESGMLLVGDSNQDVCAEFHDECEEPFPIKDWISLSWWYHHNLQKLSYRVDNIEKSMGELMSHLVQCSVTVKLPHAAIHDDLRRARWSINNGKSHNDNVELDNIIIAVLKLLEGRKRKIVRNVTDKAKKKGE